MSMTIVEAFALPDEYVTAHCGLCGNSGMIDTRGKIFTAAGVGCGIEAPCLCANGRAIKHAKERAKKAKAPPKTFWVSWEQPSKPSPTEDDPEGAAIDEPEKMGERFISYWISGWAGDSSYATVVAWVGASTSREVIEAVEKDWPVEGDRRWRFINPCKPDYDPTKGGRFSLSAEGKRRLKALTKK